MAKASLDEYKKKRKFRATPEPAPGRRRSSAKGSRRFVVQEHNARRLHWDLRLEYEGVAVSWAVPNGIPTTPDENRKAVHTEDHPLEYLTWEGEIPKGQYGAGTMAVWDSGTYELEKWEKGKVVVGFHGERLRGRYALFRAGKEEKDWMIHRIDPPEEAGDPFPESLVPMLARLAKLPAKEDAWAVEVKWDGVRAIAYCRPGRIVLQSRNLNEITRQYPEVRSLSRAIGSRDAVLDGELVAFDEEGKPSFGRLQQRIHQTSETVVRRRMKSHPVTYLIFDLLYLDGRNLMDEPYRRRRELLEELDLNGASWQTPGYSIGHAKELLEASREQHLEGLVLKRLDSPYVPGKRTGAWLKVKNSLRQELVIGGWQPGEGRRRNQIGSLLVGYFDPDEGDGLRYAGKVGTGFNDKDLVDLLDRLRKLERKTSPFTGRHAPRKGHFVEPVLVAEVEYSQLTTDGLLRHPSFKGLRNDKAASEVGLEIPAEAGLEAPAGPDRRSLVQTAKRMPRNKAEVEVEGKTLRLSNLDKVMYPKAGFTKGDVIDWYARMADVLLPHLRNRPLTLKRYPDGVEGEHFYEKRCPAHRPEWVETARVWSDRNRGEIDYCVVNDLPALVWAANLANIELHTSLSPADELERPTAMVFDLDPGAPADIRDCAQVAVWIRGMLEQFDLRSHAKTSGSKGMQLYVPLNSEVTYEETKPFAKAVAATLERRFPERVISRMVKSRRRGKVLIDWSQNDPYKTTVCVYSLRARERPVVSTPLEWSEVEAAVGGNGRAGKGGAGLAFDHADVLIRIAERGDLFAPLLTEQQVLPEL